MDEKNAENHDWYVMKDIHVTIVLVPKKLDEEDEEDQMKIVLPVPIQSSVQTMLVTNQNNYQNVLLSTLLLYKHENTSLSTGIWKP